MTMNEERIAVLGAGPMGLGASETNERAGILAKFEIFGADGVGNP